MSPLRWLELAAGILIVWIVMRDLFAVAVVPRPARGRFRPASIITRVTWRIWRWISTRWGAGLPREDRLGAYGPLLVMILLSCWFLGLVVGYGLMIGALRYQLAPVPTNLGECFYVAAGLMVGLTDFAAVGLVTRVLAVIEGATGLALVAVVISLLFSLYASFQKREILIITLDALAGAPPSGVVLLENSLKYDMIGHLDETFDRWKVWSAEVLESHLAYPILAYFRSSHDNESWVSAIGAVLDAAVLVLTTVEDVPRGPAKLMYNAGAHLVEDLSWFFRTSHLHEAGIERFEFDQACERLSEAGS